MNKAISLLVMVLFLSPAVTHAGKASKAGKCKNNLTEHSCAQVKGAKRAHVCRSGKISKKRLEKMCKTGPVKAKRKAKAKRAKTQTKKAS